MAVVTTGFISGIKGNSSAGRPFKTDSLESVLIKRSLPRVSKDILSSAILLTKSAKVLAGTVSSPCSSICPPTLARVAISKLVEEIASCPVSVFKSRLFKIGRADDPPTTREVRFRAFFKFSLVQVVFIWDEKFDTSFFYRIFYKLKKL